MPQLLHNSKRLTVAALLAALLTTLVLVALPNPASAIKGSALTRAGLSQRESQKAKKLGRAKRQPPACPDNCRIVGSVTGFQVKAPGSRQNMFRSHELGKVVAWGIALAKPTPDQRQGAGTIFPSEQFNNQPTARLAVLKRTTGNKYKLLRQSPVVKLNPYYGQSPIFTLGEPLRIPKGGVVALTTPTWMPNNVVKNSKKSKLLVSRTGDNAKCNDEKAAVNARPAQKVGKERRFGCSFQGRIVYSAYYVPKT